MDPPGDIGTVTVESSVDWLSVRPASVDGDGVGQYRASVDRGLLPDGIYSGLIVATSDVNQCVGSHVCLQTGCGQRTCWRSTAGV